MGYDEFKSRNFDKTLQVGSNKLLYKSLNLNIMKVLRNLQVSLWFKYECTPLSQLSMICWYRELLHLKMF